MENKNTIGKKLKLARVNKGLTQEQVAKMVGVSPQTISGYETNYRQPDISMLSRLADIYEVSAELLFSKDHQNLTKKDNGQKNKVTIDERVKNLPESDRNIVETLLSHLERKNANHNGEEAASGE